MSTFTESEIDNSNDDFEIRFRYQKRTEKVFERLHSLVQAGYVPDFSSDGCALGLYHPSLKFVHRSLALYYSGRVLSFTNHAEEIDVDLEDEAKFNKFLLNVPKPTWWDLRREKWQMPISVVVFWGGGWVIISIVEWILKSVGRKFGFL